jgi:hypothetical protein
VSQVPETPRYVPLALTAPDKQGWMELDSEVITIGTDAHVEIDFYLQEVGRPFRLVVTRIAFRAVYLTPLKLEDD